MVRRLHCLVVALVFVVAAVTSCASNQRSQSRFCRKLRADLVEGSLATGQMTGSQAAGFLDAIDALGKVAPTAYASQLTAIAGKASPQLTGQGADFTWVWTTSPGSDLVLNAERDCNVAAAQFRPS
jgi:hypothetical protein